MENSPLRLTVRGFRSLPDAEIELGRVNVFVGPALSGKTSLLDALRWLAGLPMAGRAPALVDAKWPGFEFSLASKPPSLSARLTIGDEPRDDTQTGIRAAFYALTCSPGAWRLVLDAERVLTAEWDDAARWIGEAVGGGFSRTDIEPMVTALGDIALRLWRGQTDPADFDATLGSLGRAYDITRKARNHLMPVANWRPVTIDAEAEAVAHRAVERLTAERNAILAAKPPTFAEIQSAKTDEARAALQARLDATAGLRPLELVRKELRLAQNALDKFVKLRGSIREAQLAATRVAELDRELEALAALQDLYGPNGCRTRLFGKSTAFCAAMQDAARRLFDNPDLTINVQRATLNLSGEEGSFCQWSDSERVKLAVAMQLAVGVIFDFWLVAIDRFESCDPATQRHILRVLVDSLPAHGTALLMSAQEVEPSPDVTFWRGPDWHVEKGTDQ